MVVHILKFIKSQIYSNFIKKKKMKWLLALQKYQIALIAQEKMAKLV
jgi:hypothetical protein